MASVPITRVSKVKNTKKLSSCGMAIGASAPPRKGFVLRYADRHAAPIRFYPSSPPVQMLGCLFSYFSNSLSSMVHISTSTF